MKLTQITVNTKPLIQQQVLLNEHSRYKRCLLPE